MFINHNWIYKYARFINTQNVYKRFKFAMGKFMIYKSIYLHWFINPPISDSSVLLFLDIVICVHFESVSFSHNDRQYIRIWLH